MLVGQGEGRPYVLILVAREFHSRRLRPLMRNSPLRIGPKMSQSPCPVRLPCESETHGDRMDVGPRMKLPNTAHTSRPWRIHALTRDFRLEDVWALPTPGGPDDFPRLVQLVASFDPSRGSPLAVRTLFAIRWQVGGLLGWDEPGNDGEQPTLRDRLPADLR